MKKRRGPARAIGDLMDQLNHMNHIRTHFGVSLRKMGLD
jgi:hypothetical protein